jgi:hypothetical protein
MIILRSCYNCISVQVSGKQEPCFSCMTVLAPGERPYKNWKGILNGEPKTGDKT